jgi:hypothetical protein
MKNLNLSPDPSSYVSELKRDIATTDKNNFVSGVFLILGTDRS